MGGINIEGFLGDGLAPLLGHGADGAHVVEAIGEFNDDDANIAGHGEEHFAEALGLAVFAVGETDFAEFGDAVNATCDVFAEFFANFFEFDRRVFDDVVQQAGFNADEIHLHVGQDVGDSERMGDVGFARFAFLGAVLLGGKPIGEVERRQIFLGAEETHLLFESAIEFLYLGRFQNAGRHEGLSTSVEGGDWRWIGERSCVAVPLKTCGARNRPTP